MGKYGQLEVEVRVYESKTKPTPTAKGGVYQTIGNCHATIKVDDMVLFEDLQGRLSRFFKTVEDFEKGENANLIIDYSNSIKLESGTYMDKSKPSNEFQAILEVETMKTFSSGFSKSEREENNAKVVGMDVSEYTKLMNKAMEQAGKISGELEQKQSENSNNKTAMEQLEAEIGKNHKQSG